MGTLAETILERDKERGRRRSLVLRQGRTTQSQPKSGQPLRGGLSLAYCYVAPSHRSALTTVSSSRLALGSNIGHQCTYYLSEVQ